MIIKFCLHFRENSDPDPWFEKNGYPDQDVRIFEVFSTFFST